MEQDFLINRGQSRRNQGNVREKVLGVVIHLCSGLIHGTESVYSENSKSNRLAYEQRFRCDLWFHPRKKLDHFSIGTEYAMCEQQYMRVDEHGVMRVGTARVTLEGVQGLRACEADPDVPLL